jgi:hypothetical protein
VSVIGWLLEGDPAIRWQVLGDLTDAPAGDVAAERARVEHGGWGARLLALEDPGSLWDGGARFPASYGSRRPVFPRRCTAPPANSTGGTSGARTNSRRNPGQFTVATISRIRRRRTGPKCT